jgi:serine kinase of HPr protein (carbohydrate metabolism regulator)
MTTPITDPEYRQTVHATAVAIGKTCVLLRGRSGSGKSSLAFALIDRVRIGDGFAAFVADDRVELCLDRGRLIARAPQKSAGLAELYGRGIEKVEYVTAAEVRLVVDLVEAADFIRMPQPEDLVTTVEGVELARQPVPARRPDEAVRLILTALRDLSPE